jgi:predicted protein tyrosine phosphatase
MTTPNRFLFCCNQGRNRSRVACELVEERMAKKGLLIETRVVGIYSDENPLTAELMAWASVIFLFQDDHLPLLQARFMQDMHRMRCLLVGPIPDVFDYGSPVLLKRVRAGLRGWWELLDDVASS